MVDATWRVQSNSGTETGVTGPTPTLPNPTQEGSTLLLMMAAKTASIGPQNQSFDPPWLADLGPANSTYLWRRDNQPGGETSWAITGSLSANWAWHIQEWSALSTVANPDATSTSAGTPVFVIYTAGDQPVQLSVRASPPSPDVTDYVALVVAGVGSSGTAGVWPAGRSWSSPWTEVAAPAVGDGSHSTDRLLLVAEAYPAATGSQDVTLTWDITGGGAYSDKQVNFGSACYQPEAPPVPAEVLAA